MDNDKRKRVLIDDLEVKIAEREQIIANIRARHAIELSEAEEPLLLLKLQKEALDKLK